MGAPEILVGSTGFVGGNLVRSHAFDLEVHSSDVSRAFGIDASLVVYAGVPAAMFLANANPEADLDLMRQARENLRQIDAKRVVLVSTVAVYADTKGGDEASPMPTDGLAPYGANRLQLEKWVREDHPDALVARLPALYGHGLKKNFLYDLIHRAPAMLPDARYEKLALDSELVARSYEHGDNGFWRLRPGVDAAALRDWFAGTPYDALTFTDSRSRFQFFDLSELWGIIEWALRENIQLLNVTTPPVSACEVYTYVTGGQWENELDRPPFDYDLRSIHMPNAHGKPGYRGTREQELDSIAKFVHRQVESL